MNKISQLTVVTAGILFLGLALLGPGVSSAVALEFTPSEKAELDGFIQEHGNDPDLRGVVEGIERDLEDARDTRDALEQADHSEPETPAVPEVSSEGAATSGEGTGTASSVETEARESQEVESASVSEKTDESSANSAEETCPDNPSLAKDDPGCGGT